jgi:NAD(P)-dependent dehydrogenase (short-subunit alcohol dehydrogenase family)
MTSGALMYRPRVGFSPFVGIGGGKEALARALALDLAPARANLISPGAIETELLYTSAPNVPKETLKASYAKMSVLARVGDPEDVAEAYLALMRNGFQTGTTVHVEGGYLIKS